MLTCMDKGCNACGKVLPLDDDHWYWRVNPKSGNRVTQGGRCRDCTREAQKAAPKALRTDAQRERENAARRAQRAANGATPRPMPAILRRPWAPPAASQNKPLAPPSPPVTPHLDPAVMNTAVMYTAAMLREHVTKPTADGS
jgi:hypothetical protein